MPAGPRVAFIVTRSDQMGGASMHVLHLAERLAAEGCEPVVLSGGSGEFSRRLAGSRIPHRSVRHLVRPVAPLRDVLGVLEVTRLLRELGPDLVATHSAKAGLIGRIAAARLGLPAIHTVHGWAMAQGGGFGPWALRAAERAMRSRTARYVTVSEHDRGIALEHRLGKPGAFITIRNGVPDVPVEQHADPGLMPPRIVMVARFERQKDHPLLLAALAALRGMDWELDLVGTGPLEQAVSSLAQQLGLERRIRFLGARHDVDSILSAAQLKVLASHWEGLPLSVLEAMRAGLPIVASAIGGVPEAVRDGETGLLVPAGELNALQAALGRLLTNPAERIAMGAAGRASYVRSFTFERMFEQTLSLYREVAAG